MKTKIIIFLITIYLSLLPFIYNNHNPELSSKKNNQIEINIEYKLTKYPILNKEIEKTIDYHKRIFYNSIDNNTINNITYTLYITYKEYNYNNYISYIFYIETFLGGPHPNHQITTLNYNITNNKLININTLIQNNPAILNTLSNLSRDKLDKIEVFNDYNLKDMMIEGTKPTKNNFKNFIFTNNGLMIIFERYQIAPYYLGEYNITIPYNNLNLNI